MTIKSTLVRATAVAAFAFAAGLTGANEAQACLLGQNRILITFADQFAKRYCKAINNDIQITRVGVTQVRGSIIKASVSTVGEAGTCTFYAITSQGDLHRKFNLGAFSDKSASFVRNVYYGFRLGC